MQNAWRKYFAFNKRERKGILVLTFLNLAALVLLSHKSQLLPQVTFPAKSINSYSVSGNNNFRKSPSSPLLHEDPPSRKSTFKVSGIIELNEADSVQLVGLKGIGPSFAKRILKYRIRLGGYYCIDQLKEVYGMDAERFRLLADQVKVDSLQIQQMNINILPPDSLKGHPYIRWALANLITNYRQKHGPYQSVSDLKNLDLVTDSIYRKLAPYCRVK